MCSSDLDERCTGVFWVVSIPGEERYYETIDGRRYLVTKLRNALFGTSAGTATVGPASLSYRERSAPITFFSRPGAVKTIETDPFEIEIVALPSEGRPSGFGGAVGDFDFAASLDADRVDQWKPATLKISISGRGNIRSVEIGRASCRERV